MYLPQRRSEQRVSGAWRVVMHSSLSACKRKVHYNRAQAKEQVRVRGGEGSYYLCEHCGTYHVTHQQSHKIHESTWRKVRRSLERREAS